MQNGFYSLFDTALGRCGLAWGGGGILSVSFAESDDAKTRASLMRRAQDAVEVTKPPGEIAHVVSDIIALFEGKVRDLSYASLDLTGIAEFDRTLYDLTLAIRPGETKTYGDLARALGDITLSRRVGQSLGRNPFPIIVPCHRVVGADGTMTGFSAPGGTDVKRRLLKIEGALGPDLFDLLE